MKKYTDKEIMSIFGISNATFYRIKQNNQLGGNNKYYYKYRAKFSNRRKTKISQSIIKYIIKYVTTKINFDYNTLIKLIHTNYKIRISKSSIYKILKDNKIKKKKLYTKIKLDTNPILRNNKIKTFKKQIENALEKNPNNIISIDESSIDSHISANYGWSKKGIKLEKIIQHKRIRYTLLLEISRDKILYKKIIKGSANGDIFFKFIKKIIKKLNINENNYILLDNARIHHYTKVKKYIKNIPKIEFIYNVPYSPETNPIERVFNDIKKYLKNETINNNDITYKIIKSLNVNDSSKKFSAYFDKSLIYEIKKI